MDRKILRTLDANINRACEGLRVCEDICRFVLDNKKYSEKLKAVRHFLRNLFDAEMLLSARDSITDVGKNTLKYGSETRDDLLSILKANLKRVEESFRVIEEFAKLKDLGVEPQQIADIEAMRFKVYSLEKDIVMCLRNL